MHKTSNPLFQFIATLAFSICLTAILGTNTFAAENTLTITGFQTPGDFLVSQSYDAIVFENSHIGGHLRLPKAQSETPLVITIDAASNVGGIVVDRPMSVTNQGRIDNLLVMQPTAILGEGTITYTFFDAPATVTNQVDVWIDPKGEATFTKAPLSYYTNEAKKNTPLSVLKPGKLTILDREFHFNDKLELVSAQPPIALPKVQMQTGFVTIEGKPYFFNEDGTMLKNAWKDNFKAQSDGVLFNTLTGDAPMDKDIGALLATITAKATTDKDKMLAIYKWMPSHINWRNVPVDISGGYTDAKVLELARYAIDNRKCSCEHYACLEALLLRRMGYPTQVIAGKGLARGLDHSWVRINIDGAFVNFDPQYESTYMRDQPLSNFLVTDDVFRKSHKW